MGGGYSERSEKIKRLKPSYFESVACIGVNVQLKSRGAAVSSGAQPPARCGRRRGLEKFSDRSSGPLPAGGCCQHWHCHRDPRGHVTLTLTLLHCLHCPANTFRLCPLCAGEAVARSEVEMAGQRLGVI